MTAGAKSTTPLRANAAWYVVGLLACLGFFSIVDRLALALLIDPLRADLGISDIEAGLLIGPAFAMVYSVAAFPLAWAIDKTNRKWICAIGVALWSTCTIGSAFAPSFEWLLTLRMGLGIGEAMLNPVAVSLIGDLFERERRATPAAVFMTAQSVGNAAAFILVAAALDLAGPYPVVGGISIAGWRVALFAVGVPSLLLGLVWAVTFREPARGRHDVSRQDPEGPIPRGELFAALRLFLPLLIGCNAVTMVSFVCATWFPTFLIRDHQAPVATVGYLFGTTTMIGGIVGALALPMLAERAVLRGRKTAMLWLAILVIPLALTTFLAALAAADLLTASILVGIFFGLNTAIATLPSVIISALSPPGIRARLVAMHLLLQALLVTSLGPIVVPFLSDRLFEGSLGASMGLVASVAYPFALVMMIIAYPTYRRAVSQIPGEIARQDAIT